MLLLSCTWLMLLNKMLNEYFYKSTCIRALHVLYYRNIKKEIKCIEIYYIIKMCFSFIFVEEELFKNKFIM